MAIYHMHVGIISRKKGRSSVAAAAYRAGVKIHNERDGITHDFTRKTGITHSEIMLPDHAATRLQDRAILWNEVEKSEKRCDSQTARDIDVALPIEFEHEEQIEVIREYIQENFISEGMCADFAIHDKGDGNPHAHILLTTREVSEKGFGGKNRDWNKVEHLEKWRENWANVCNEHLKAKGLDERIDHRTLEAQGINREPTIHIGVAAKAMEKKGINTDRMRIHREIVARNEQLTAENTAEYMHDLKQAYVISNKEITETKQKDADMRREINNIRHKSEELDERAKQIDSTKNKLDELKLERQSMGFFKSKKAIDKQIKQLERSHEQARDSFKRNYFVTPEEAEAEQKRLEYKRLDIERAQERQLDRLSQLVADKDIFAFEYQRQKLLAEINPEKQKIQDGLLELDKKHLSQEQSIQNKQEWSAHTRTLDIVTEKNFQEIIKELRPEYKKLLIERREQEQEQDYKRIRRFER